MKRSTAFVVLSLLCFVPTLRGDAVRPSCASCGFLYRDGTFTLINVPGADSTIPTGINDVGQIVGSYSGTSVLDPHGPFLYTGGVYTTFQYPSGLIGGPTGINNSGQIVGNVIYESDRYGSSVHGILKSGDTFTLFEYPGALSTVAEGINDRGQIVGRYKNCLECGWHNFIKEGGTYKYIPDHWEFGEARAVSINNNEQIVGVGGAYLKRGFLFEDGTFSSIRYPVDYWPLYAPTYPADINDNGDIVGAYVDWPPGTYGAQWLGFLYKGGSYETIVLPALGTTFPTGINNSGDIIGTYTPFYPVPEPSTLIMLGSGILGIAGRMRRNRAA